jgi:hypothetical protein
MIETWILYAGIAGALVLISIPAAGFAYGQLEKHSDRFPDPPETNE